MAKLIGTGKDPRFMKGADFDVHDDDVEHYTKNGLGKVVDPVANPEVLHPGEKIIVADPQHEQDREAVSDQADHGTTSRTASRVESTSSKTTAAAKREAAKEAKGGAGDATGADAGK